MRDLVGGVGGMDCAKKGRRFCGTAVMREEDKEGGGGEMHTSCKPEWEWNPVAEKILRFRTPWQHLSAMPSTGASVREGEEDGCYGGE